ncbi:Hypothetical protein Y17_2561 [Pectobacterium wasabiae CFBP 3304]|nr:Hypothetical protein Y17_2561 [Pectobacterium wasabiae CFBP 3304]
MAVILQFILQENLPDDTRTPQYNREENEASVMKPAGHAEKGSHNPKHMENTQPTEKRKVWHRTNYLLASSIFIPFSTSECVE